MHRRHRTVLLTLAALALPAAAARADLIQLITGERIEGEAKESGGKWKVRLYKGTRTFPKSEVKFIEQRELSWDVAKRREREIPADADDRTVVDARLEIARFLKENRAYTPELEELEHRQYQFVLKKDAENEEAHAGLGHVRWVNWWFDDEKKRDEFRKRAKPEEMEPLGYVKYRKTGMWELKEDVEAMESGKVRFKGQWMTEDEKKIAQGYVRVDGEWKLARDIENAKRTEEIEKALGEKPVTVTMSDNFRFISWHPVGETAQLKELAEKAYRWYRELLDIPLPKGDDVGEVLFTEPIEIYCFVDGKRKDKWLEAVAPGLGYDSGSIEFYKKGSGWHRLSPFPYFVSAGKEGEKNRQRDPEADFDQTAKHVASMVGRIVLDRIRDHGTHPWLAEATGLLTEIEHHETADCCYVTMTEYREEVAGKDGSKAKYIEFMKKQIAAGLDRPMRQILTMELNKLDWADSVKAWSFLKFLAAKYRKEYRELMRQPFLQVDTITPEQIAAAVRGAEAKKTEEGKPPPKAADEGPIPEAPVTVLGPGAAEVTKGSKEERAIQGATAEAWLENGLGKGILDLEKEWKDWVKAQP